MTHQIELPHLSMLLVEVPIPNYAFIIKEGFKYLCTYPDISEEQAAKVVERYIYSGRTSYYAYADYSGKLPESEHDIITTALESFHSLLTANNIAPTKRWAVLYQPKK